MPGLRLALRRMVAMTTRKQDIAARAARAPRSQPKPVELEARIRQITGIISALEEERVVLILRLYMAQNYEGS